MIWFGRTQDPPLHLGPFLRCIAGRRGRRPLLMKTKNFIKYGFSDAINLIIENIEMNKTFRNLENIVEKN